MTEPTTPADISRYACREHYRATDSRGRGCRTCLTERQARKQASNATTSWRDVDRSTRDYLRGHRVHGYV